MVVDSSALLAVVLIETDAEDLLSKLLEASTLKISAVTLVEASMVALSRGGETRLNALDALISNLGMTVVAVDRAQAILARSAFDKYGKGRHRSKLNLGDCFPYALARYVGEPLLFKGDDFSQTDIERA